MSHPVPGREYGQNEYKSHSPHKDVMPNKKRKAVKTAMRKSVFKNKEEKRVAMKNIERHMSSKKFQDNSHGGYNDN